MMQRLDEFSKGEAVRSSGQVGQIKLTQLTRRQLIPL